MSNFEIYKDQQVTGMCSLLDHTTQSPRSNMSNSFLMSTHSTQSPEPQKLKQYVSESSPKTMAFHNYSVENKTPQDKKKAKMHQQQVKIENKVEPNLTSNISTDTDEIQLLKQHLRQKYQNYSDQEIEDIIYKFINEYMLKMKSNQGSLTNSVDSLQDVVDESRNSLSSNLDWNDRQQLEKYCCKQKKIEKEEGFRPSQYFGAISVDQLEDGIGDPKIDQLFSECFGIKPKPKKKTRAVVKQECAKVEKVKQQMVEVPPVQNQIQAPKNKMYSILRNLFQNGIQEGQEDECANVLIDKLNQMPTQQHFQVLHQEQKKPNNKVKSSHQDSLKKYMSPQEMQKLKQSKNASKSIINNENNIEGLVSPKNNSLKQQMIQNYKVAQTQMNSPQSLTNSQYGKHFQQLSSLIGNSNTSKSKISNNQTLSHQSSLSNFSNAGLSKKHQSSNSLNKQQYKSILYKHQAPHHQNMLSISSQQSIENKPKQMHKLSYLNQKQPYITASVNLANCNDGNEVQQKQAPKPPHNNKQLNAKNKRDSDETVQIQSRNDNIEVLTNSPKISPQRTLLQMHSQSNPGIEKCQISSGHTKSIQSFAEGLYSQNSIPTTQRSIGTSSKTLGRNNSQNFFKTAKTFNNIQSFLMQSPELDQDTLQNPGIKYFETESTTSPLGFINQQIEMVNNSQAMKGQRPQTTISGIFNSTSNVNQYMNTANQLASSGRPPSKHTNNQSQGFLSHTSSTKNLKHMQIKNLQLTAHNSSRKQKESELVDAPKSSRHPQQKYSTTTSSHVTSLSRERQAQKSNERSNKPHVYTVDQDSESIEKKRMMYKTQKISATSLSKNLSLVASGSQKQLQKQAVTRNHQNVNGGIVKGNSTTMINEYMRNQSKTNESGSNKQQSFNQTIQRINKSLDKIKQIFMNGKPVQVPQSTKNVSSEQKINDLFQQINSYKTFIKKAKPSTDQGSIASMKQKPSSSMQKGLRKEGQNNSIDQTNIVAKKASENFKKYLSGTQLGNPGYNSFK